MNWLDVVLLVTFGLYAVNGWANGFVSNVFSAGGLLVGFVLGILFAPVIFERNPGDPTSALLSIAFVVIVTGTGNFFGALIGRSLRIERGPGRTVDAAVGAVFGTVVVMAASWALGYAVSASSLPHVGAAVRDSTVLARVDSLMPERASNTLRAFTDTLTVDVFPQYLDPFETEVIPSADPPDPTILALPAVQAARDSVARVLGTAECNRVIEGTGFVISRGHVMTNAHVIAGVDEPTVTLGNREYDAVPVLFDPDLDLAVMAVRGLVAKPLKFDTSAETGDSTVVLGFPENGPFDARAARIRGEIDLHGPDIRGKGKVSRHVFSIRSLVRSGNSGGPLISTKGDVAGVIFAASLSDPETGYAVTAEEALPIARAGVRSDGVVDTGRCA